MTQRQEDGRTLVRFVCETGCPDSGPAGYAKFGGRVFVRLPGSGDVMFIYWLELKKLLSSAAVWGFLAVCLLFNLFIIGQFR